MKVLNSFVITFHRQNYLYLQLTCQLAYPLQLVVKQIHEMCIFVQHYFFRDESSHQHKKRAWVKLHYYTCTA